MTPRSFAGILFAAALLSFSGLMPFGCLGGTSTDAGNPEMKLGIRSPEGVVPFHGSFTAYASGGKPQFQNVYPDDDSRPRTSFTPSGYGAFSILPVPGKSVVGIPLDFFELLVNNQAVYALSKRSGPSAGASNQALPPLNFVMWGDLEPTIGVLQGVEFNPETRRYHVVGQADADTLWLKVAPQKSYSGTLNIEGLKDPVALFTPGLPFSAQLEENRFRFEDMPQGVFPLELVTQAGLVYAVDSLRLGDDTLLTLNHGARLDSIDMPPPIPTLDPPVASPAGPHHFTDSVAVTLKAEVDADIYYTLNGDIPTRAAYHYDGSKPLTFKTTTLLTAVAYLKKHKPSRPSVNNYLRVPHAPTASPMTGTYSGPVSVTLASQDGAAPEIAILYTLDGSDPTGESSVYVPGNPLLITETTTLKAAAKNGLGLGAVLSEVYTIIADSTAAPP